MGSQDRLLGGYVFVTPEYNHGISGALKNAIDFLYAEWNDNAAFVVDVPCCAEASRRSSGT
jgi:NAD(P)H-dependent FMN reductase